MDYTQVAIKWREDSEEKAEIIIALLGELPFDTFENTETSVDAFITTLMYNAPIIAEIQKLSIEHNFSFSVEHIPHINWNAEWEKNYEPVIVNDFVAVRADFHAPILNVEHEIIITPRMAFGTGHHATTYTVMEMMRDINFKNKTVLDFGCGSGILAILAEKLGAQSVLAIDNDVNCVENTVLNAQINHSNIIETRLASIEQLESSKFDVIIANINRNVLLATMPNMSEHLLAGGQLVISGFYKSDEKILISVAEQNNLTAKAVKQKDDWSCLLLYSLS